MHVLHNKFKKKYIKKRQDTEYCLLLIVHWTGLAVYIQNKYWPVQSVKTKTKRVDKQIGILQTDKTNVIKRQNC